MTSAPTIKGIFKRVSSTAIRCISLIFRTPFTLKKPVISCFRIISVSSPFITVPALIAYRGRFNWPCSPVQSSGPSVRSQNRPSPCYPSHKRRTSLQEACKQYNCKISNFHISNILMVHLFQIQYPTGIITHFICIHYVLRESPVRGSSGKSHSVPFLQRREGHCQCGSAHEYGIVSPHPIPPS